MVGSNGGNPPSVSAQEISEPSDWLGLFMAWGMASVKLDTLGASSWAVVCTTRLIRRLLWLVLLVVSGLEPADTMDGVLVWRADPRLVVALGPSAVSSPCDAAAICCIGGGGALVALVAADVSIG